MMRDVRWFFWMVVEETLGRLLWGTRWYFYLFYYGASAKDAGWAMRETYRDLANGKI